MPHQAISVRRGLPAALAAMIGFVIIALVPAPAALAAPSSPAKDSPAKSSPAYRIQLDQTGGLIGVARHYVVDENTPNAAGVLALAGTDEFRHLKRAYLPDQTCSDCFTYVVTVFYFGEPTKTVVTMDSAKAPDVLWKVITLVRQLGSAS